MCGMDEILKNLNPEQVRAVTAPDGPVLIVAGAGSGKTRVLTSKIAYQIAQGANPSRILALTFTKKAAGEMKDRIATLVGARNAAKIQMGTFHSVFARILRQYAELLGYPQSYTIYDTTDSQNAIKGIIKSIPLDDKVYKPKEVLSRISNAKNDLVTAADYAADNERVAADRNARKPETARIFRLYEEFCKKSGVMDFDDILLNMDRLLRDFPEARDDVAGRFTHILVDEYQDTNKAQYIILKRLCTFTKNICVVGDDSQSIYAFRGARIENILSFQKDFPDAKIYRLEQNYRSTQSIVEAANSLIAKNTSRIPKTCKAVAGAGEKIRILNAFSENEEAYLIASSIVSRMSSDGAAYKDFAVLYRTNSQSRALEEALRRRNLPYCIWAGNSFFERAEVKDVMAYLKLIVNPSDDISFRRVVNLPARGIGGTSLSVLQDVATQRNIPLMQAAGDKQTLLDAGLKDGVVKKLRAFFDMIQTHGEKALEKDAHSVAVSIASESGIYLHFKSDTSIEGQSRTANVDELLNSIASFQERRKGEWMESLIEDGADPDAISEDSCPPALLMDFLEDIALLSNADVSDEEASNKIALMTVHSAKGLEFPYVFVSGMEENLFPSGGYLASTADIEEERRLFYVAMTRAEKAVTLTWSTTRMHNGSHESHDMSRFLKEIDPRYIDNPPKTAAFRSTFGTASVSGFRPSSSRPNVTQSQFGGGNRRFFGDAPKPLPAKPAFPSRHSAPAPSKPGVFHSRQEAASRDLPPVIPDFIPTLPEKLAEGDIVEHNRFGRGKILSITGKMPDAKARIAFDQYGEKTLLLSYAKLRLCES